MLKTPYFYWEKLLLMPSITEMPLNAHECAIKLHNIACNYTEKSK